MSNATIAVGIVCKTPTPGLSKTRLSPPLRPEDCAGLSGCFIRDLSATIDAVTGGEGATGYAIYTPLGTERGLRTYIPASFALLPQVEGEFGIRLQTAVSDLLGRGHSGAILINSDSPTLPASLLREAIHAVASGDNIVLSRALDGGYTLIGLSKMHEALFQDMPWSTPAVYDLTVERARKLGVPVIDVAPWYDVDDAESLKMLEDELAGETLSFSPFVRGSQAPHTMRYLATHLNRAPVKQKVSAVS